jgi:hypothetical protein
MLSIQHLKKHWVFNRDRYLAAVKIDPLSSVVLPEGFADHLSECLKRQSSEDRVFQEDTPEASAPRGGGEYDFAEVIIYRFRRGDPLGGWYREKYCETDNPHGA